MADADEALLVLRVREAVESREAAEIEAFSSALRLFKTDPMEGRRRLLATEAGCDKLLGLLALLQTNLARPVWSDDDSKELVGLEGRPRDDYEPALSGFVETFERSQAIRYSLEVGGGEPLRGLARNEAIDERKALAPMVETAKSMILERLNNLQRTFEEYRELRRSEEDSLVSLTTTAARFDPTDAGRLRRRYLGDSQRDFFKAIAVARQESDRAISRNEPIFQQARPAPSEYSEPSTAREQHQPDVSRNEPIDEPSQPTDEVESSKSVESTEPPRSPSRAKRGRTISPNEPKSVCEENADLTDFSSQSMESCECPTAGS